MQSFNDIQSNIVKSFLTKNLYHEWKTAEHPKNAIIWTYLSYRLATLQVMVVLHTASRNDEHTLVIE